MKKRAFALITALCMTLTCFASAETVKHERVYAVTNADGDALTVIDNVRLENGDALAEIDDRTLLTALENVEIASQIVKDPLPAADVLRDVGLGERMANFPAQLSGGEQQRVSIARALAKRPKLLLCDEPTGALDSDTGRKVFTLLQKMSRTYGSAVVVVTHNAAVAPAADRVIRLKDGRIHSLIDNSAPVSMEEVEL